MSNIHVLTVATHNQGYFDILKQSAKRHNIKLKVLGWGEKYYGHSFKLEKIKTYLDTLPKNNNDIILFVDGFDSILLDNSQNIIKKFKQLNVPIIFSEDAKFTKIMISNNISKYKLCKKNNKLYFINSGMYIGYKKPLLNLINDALKLSKITYINDDQFLIQKLCRKHKLVTDLNNELFYNIHYIFNKNKIEIKNKKVVINGYEPCAISAPGRQGISNIIKELGYETKGIKDNNQITFILNPDKMINFKVIIYYVSMLICILLVVKIFRSNL